MMDSADILKPMLAMVLLTALATVRLFWVNITSALTGKVRYGFFKYFEGESPDRMKKARDLYKNLWEIPTLFYVLVILLYVSRQVDAADVGLAWAFVASRWVHAAIRITDNHVVRRLTAFVAGFSILFAHWVWFAVRVLG